MIFDRRTSLRASFSCEAVYPMDARVQKLGGPGGACALLREEAHHVVFGSGVDQTPRGRCPVGEPVAYTVAYSHSSQP